MLKFSSEQLASFGCKTHDELAVKITAAITALPVLQSAHDALAFKLDAANVTVGELKAALETAAGVATAASGKIVALEAAVKPETLKLLAREEATMVLGAAGAPTSGAVAPGAAGAQGGAKEDTGLDASGKVVNWTAHAEFLKNNPAK